MVTAGYAWNFKKYAKEQSIIEREKYSAETFSRDYKVEFWQDKILCRRGYIGKVSVILRRI